ncbi:MAG: VanZ family protein [Desulfobacterales bacterium]|nr:VanZ family protein [Desulfobacterales bacterium]
MRETNQSKLRIFLLGWLPLIAACVAIFIQSSFRGPERMPEVRFLDKLLHFGVYAVLGILFYRAYETLPLKDNRRLLIFFSIISAIFFGISDEIHQYFVPFRHAELLDVMANCAGSISGVFFYDWWKIRKKLPLLGKS